jgi:PadR family transcriptional regulator, regulatory protein PadR
MTLALLVLKTLQTMGPLHGYGIARRIEQTSGAQLCINYGTLYPALLNLEQEDYIHSEWGVSDNIAPPPVLAFAWRLRGTRRTLLLRRW